MNPRVSVIIPSYNSETTICAALDSVNAQTRLPDEILLIDDASLDQTLAVAKRWAAAHSSPLQIHPQTVNTGPAGARNTGLQYAIGEWIAFLDADDAWLPMHLELHFNTLVRHPDAVLLCGETLPFDELPPPPLTDSDLPLRPLNLENFVSCNPVATSTVLVRREALQSAGGFDIQFRGPEDYDLWLRIAATGASCLRLDIPRSRYRSTPGSLSMDDRTFLPQVLRVLDKAFGPGGALQGHRHWRRLALAEQYTSASWMAYRRGDRRRALSLLLRSWSYGFLRIRKEHANPMQRFKLLTRYLFVPE